MPKKGKSRSRNRGVNNPNRAPIGTPSPLNRRTSRRMNEYTNALATAQHTENPGLPPPLPRETVRRVRASSRDRALNVREARARAAESTADK